LGVTDDQSLRRFQARMAAIPKAVREAVAPALTTSAEEMAALMRTLAPKDTGKLAESIAVTGPGQQTPPYSQPGGSRTVRENEVAITVGGPDVRYPHLVEYGTSRAPAQPWFWPAYRSLKKRGANRIKRALGKAVKDHWGAGK
jgi:HK97 gp10 family phage protein